MKKKRSVALFLAICLIWSLCACSGTKEEVPEIVDPHAGQVEINDGSGMVWLTPAEGAAASPLTEADFTKDENGWPVYTGEDYRVLRGVDVSELQENIDWSRVKAAGIDFAILRLGFRGYGEAGRLVEDAKFRTYLERARENGLLVGAYFFSQATSVEEAEEEAAFALEILGDTPLDLPVMYDWERVGAEDSRTLSIPAGAVQGYGEAFCRTVTQGGHRSGLYFSRQLGYYGYDLAQMTDYTWWVSDPGTYPAFYYETEFWQCDCYATVPGIGIIVDLDLQFIPNT